MSQRVLRVIHTPEDPIPTRPDQLLTVMEAAARLRVGRTTAFELVRTGALPAVRFPNSRIVRVAESVVEAFIQRGGAS